MTLTLGQIIQSYLDDQVFHEEWVERIHTRNQNLLLMQPVIDQFINKTLTLEEFREQIDRRLKNDPEHQLDTWARVVPDFLWS